MAITFANAGTPYQPSAAGTSHVISIPAGVQLGDFLLAVLTNNGATSSTVTAPAGGGWTALPGTPLSNGTTHRLWAFYKIAGGAEPSTYTFTSSSQVLQGHISAWTGNDQSTPLDVTPTTTTNTSSLNISVPAITPVTTGTWVLRIATVNAGTTGGTISPPTSHAERNEAQSGGAVAHRPVEVSDIAWGGGAQAATTATSTIAGVGIGVSVALRPANGAATSFPFSTETVQRILMRR